MRPDDILFSVRARPFRPFRIRMNSGQAYDVRHPELVRVMLGSLLLFTPTDQPDVYERAQILGLTLIEKIEPIDAPAAA
jgi:hypothetical protein